MSDFIDNNNAENINGSVENSHHHQDPKTIASGDEELPQSLFVARLATYPAVAALTGLVASFPVVKVFASNAIPLMMAIRERSRPVADPVVKRASPVIIRVDKFGDNLLKTVDNNFPVLQTTQPSEVYEMARRPVVSARSAATTYSTNARGVVEHRIIEPIKSVSKAARTQYARVYDTRGKALIRARLDPVVLPLNDRLESIIVDYLPEGEEFPSSDNLSNELSRTWRLARVAIQRARPVLAEQANQVATLPQVAREHVSQTYQEKVTKHSNGGTPTAASYALAYLGTGRQLSRETRVAFLSAIFPSSSTSTATDGTTTNNSLLSRWIPNSYLSFETGNIADGSTDKVGDHSENGPIFSGLLSGGLLSRASSIVYTYILPGGNTSNTANGGTDVSDVSSVTGKLQIPEATTAAQNVSVEGEIHH